MGLLQTLLLGRPQGLRARLRRRLGLSSAAPGPSAGAGSPAASPGPGAPSSGASAPAARAPVPAEAAVGLSPEAPKDVTPPDGFEVVLHRAALPAGQVTEIIIGGRAIAVANVDGRFFACANSCPHADGPLGEGTVSGGVLTCPYHGWEFALESGACLTHPDRAVDTYAVEVVGDAVCVRL